MGNDETCLLKAGSLCDSKVTSMVSKPWLLSSCPSSAQGHPITLSGLFQTITTVFLIPSSLSLPLSVSPILLGLLDPYCCRNLVLGFERDTCDSSHSLMSLFLLVTYCFSPLPCILSHFFFSTKNRQRLMKHLLCARLCCTWADLIIRSVPG